MLRSSKNADQRKQWWYRVAGYSAVAPPPQLPVDAVVTLKLETKFIENTRRFIGSILNIICEDTMLFGHCVPSRASVRDSLLCSKC